ncbi:MAG: NAD(P)H-binding protein [Chitinivibrionia bacterium]|nr:NAD(P)H-binding protein [Chitinivibrionia bacterium]
MKVVINTPTGKIGKALTERLLETGVDLILLARSPERVEPFAKRGATVAEGNLEDVDFVVRATRGADVLFWVTPADYAAGDIRKHYNKLGRIAVRAVEENKIPRVVDLSSIGAQHKDGTGPIAGLHDIEKMLERTGAHVTHLRPAFFMENFFMQADSIASMGAIFMPVPGRTKLSMIATADIAAAAAERILDANWTGRSVLELAGPAEMTFDGAARVLGSALNKEVRHVPVSMDQTRDALVGMGISRGVADSYLEMYAAFAAGAIIPETPAALKRTSTTFDAFAENVFRPGMQAMGKQ